METRDINLFRPGQTVTIPGVEGFKKTKILAINESGVTVSSDSYDHTVISGKSPACPYVEEIVEEVERAESNISIEKGYNQSADHLAGGRVKRGSLTGKMKNIILPDKEKFTIGELAELNRIPHNYANNYVKDNLGESIIEAGKAEKKPNQKGRIANLYSKKIKIS